MIYEVTMTNGDVTYVDCDEVYQSAGGVTFNRNYTRDGERISPRSQEPNNLYDDYHGMMYNVHPYLILSEGTWLTVKQAPEDIQLQGV